ncbi:hypothetical protein FGO68_gene14352 [Halteria grandinella]|uniref:Uncharacterized protein n=1 Tax=Halteria grandinella TaxID=5974 RepID=A0A8J8NNW6_HALGN|nr:hypothetical protein FGO68_gene14352 [Halteria grandinella]
MKQNQNADIYQVDLTNMETFDKALANMCQTLSDTKYNANTDNPTVVLVITYIGILGVFSNTYLYFQLIMNSNEWNFSIIIQILIYIGLVVGVVAVDCIMIWIICYKSYHPYNYDDRRDCLARLYDYLDTKVQGGLDIAHVVFVMILILAIPPSIAAVVMLIICLISDLTDTRTKVTFACHIGAYFFIPLVVVLILRFFIIRDDIERRRENEKRYKQDHYYRFKLENQKQGKRDSQVQIE